MALTSWKTFHFFEAAQVPLPAEEDGSYSFATDITCLTTGSNSLFLGQADGTVRILSRGLRTVRSFHAVDPASRASVTQIKQIESTPLLITITEDLSSEPILKVWALDKEEKKSAGPKCLSTVTVQNGRRQFPISAFVVLEDLAQVAVGFANGAVTLIRGDLIHDRGTKQRTVFESQDPVTGLEVLEGSATVLYIATTGRIASLAISGRGQGQPARTIDNQGCGVGCMTIEKATRDIIVARDDAVYYYSRNGRGPSFAFEGPKKMITTFHDYVGVVCPPRVTQLSKSNTLRRLGGGEIDDYFATSSFTLLDTDLRYIAFTESLPSPVKTIFSEWGELFLMTMDGKLYRYREKSLQQKLEILYQRNLYLLAINMAQRAGVDKMTQNVIFRKYGDYLYQKGDYDTAMQQYLRAIDNTEPSQILRKFLDTQRIHNLIEYLEELHDHERATADHTTLLLNCYAKLKDTEKLDAFIKAPGELKFDLDTAISMCRQGGYYEQAVYLATKHGEDRLAVDILVEDLHRFEEALVYIWQMNATAVYPNLMKYARVLLEHCPDGTTQLFIDYYSGRYRPKEVAPAAITKEPQPQGYQAALQNLSSLLTLPYLNRSNVATPTSEQAQTNHGTTNGEEAHADTEGSATPAAPDYVVPKPRTAFSAFIPHRFHFIRFLEALIGVESMGPDDKADLLTTLFETYLEISNADSTSASEKDSWRQKATSLIAEAKDPNTPSSSSSSPSTGDIPTSSVLLLSKLSDFPAGTTLVQERANLYCDIFRAHASAKDTAGAISALRKYGPLDPSVYPIALSFFSSSPEILAQPGVKAEMQSILTKIDQANLMAPLQVIKILSQGGAVTMGTIKPYLSETIRRERNEMGNNRSLIESYRSDTATKAGEIEDLSTKPTVFQTRRCSSCLAPLDLPTVHFLCKHSFHQRCLNSSRLPAESRSLAEGRHDGRDETGGSDAECPLCKPQHDTIKAIRRAQIEVTDQHELFEETLKKSSDRFGTVAEFFSRGVMNKAGAAGGR